MPEQNQGTDDLRPNRTPADDRTAKIAALNDAFRRSFVGGRVMMTPGIAGLGRLRTLAVILAVRGFTTFGTDNDPHGEHDFGAFDAGPDKVFWKIDYYDLALQNGSPDPIDPAVTTRVLTIMLANEY